MPIVRRRLLRLATGAAATPFASRIVWAQTYPSRPITMVVPFPAGGSTDAVARMVAERMRTPLGQPIIIENIGAAQGTIGVGRVAHAAPDGYTIDFANGITTSSQVQHFSFPTTSPRISRRLGLWQRALG
jgi:tripartite-type tricarboxylate transporter receptor subunit TctC